MRNRRWMIGLLLAAILVPSVGCGWRRNAYRHPVAYAPPCCAVPVAAAPCCP
jgi:hypothetical protein